MSGMNVIDWLLDLLVDLGEAEDQPSRWITLRALRVLHWADGAGQSATESRATG
jgi:hypothetical protein